MAHSSFTAPGQSSIAPPPRTLSPAEQAVQERMAKLMQRRFEPFRYMDRTALQTLGIEAEMDAALDLLGLKSFAFEARPVHPTLAREFF